MKIKRNFTALVLAVVMAGTVFAGSTGAAVAGESRMIQAQSDINFIYTPHELLGMSSGPESVGRTYVLQNDIHLTHEWTPIQDFRGTFDGQGYTIHNLYVLGSRNFPNAGLFGSTNMATLRNVNVRIGSEGVTGVNFAGGLIGQAASTNVERTSAVGNVSAGIAAGGLIGRFSLGPSVTIADSYSTGRVTVNFDILTVPPHFFNAGAGGLVGLFEFARTSGSTTILNSYTTSDVFMYGHSGAHHTIGGLYGGWRHGNTNVNIPPISVVGSFRLSTQTIMVPPDSNISINHRGAILPPESMRQQASFTRWDFDEVWEFRNGENNGFPVLRMRRGDTPIPTPTPAPPAPTPTPGAPLPTPTPGAFNHGDVNGDGVIDIRDVTMLRLYLVGRINQLGPAQ